MQPTRSLRDAAVAASTAWQIRTAMACHGWSSNCVLDSRMGDPAFQAWAQRWDWHGRKSDRVSLHASAAVEAGDRAAAQDTMLSVLRRVALLADEAWTRFTDAVPCMAGDGVLAAQEAATRYAFGGGGPPSMATRPTEDLPVDHMVLCGPGRVDGADMTLSPLLDLAQRQCNYEDRLTWMGANPHSVSDRFRRWHWQAMAVPKEWRGTPVAGHRRLSSHPDLYESHVASTLKGFVFTHDRVMEIYYPGSPNGSMPPGMMTLPEHFVRFEFDVRRREITEAGADADDQEAVSGLLLLWEERRAESSHLRDILPKVTEDEVTTFIRAADRSLSDAPTSRIWGCSDLPVPHIGRPGTDETHGPGVGPGTANA